MTKDNHRMSDRRIKNILTRMLNGEEYYTNLSPRISWKEIDAMRKLGFDFQVDYTHGANAGPIAVYPLRRKEFKEAAEKWLAAH